jgi:elongation factor 1-alpha
MDPSVSTGENSDSNENNPPESEYESNNSRSDALGKALSTMLATVIKDLDSKAQDTLSSQDKLNSAINHLTRGKFFFLFNLIMDNTHPCYKVLAYLNFFLVDPDQPI